MEVRSPNVHKSFITYVIIDEESTSSFCHPSLINFLNPRNKTKHNYSVRTVNDPDPTEHVGRILINAEVKGLLVHPEVDKNVWYKLPPVFELSTLPSTKDEVCTSDDARAIPSLAPFAGEFLPLNEEAEVMLLIGRDCGYLLDTWPQTHIPPFVHRTPLGTAAVGSPASGGASRDPRSFLTRKGFKVDRTFHKPRRMLGILPGEEDPIFGTLPDDEVEDLSVEDHEFLDHIHAEIKINAEGRIQAPLPWRGKVEPYMPDNSRASYGRQVNMFKALAKDPVKQAFYFENMGQNIQNKYVEPVPQDELETDSGRVWYLPTFVVTSKRKKLRTVFDSAAVFGLPPTCLNDKMLSGPDRNNALRDVLLRFREHNVGFIADVESMFFQFHVNEEHRDYMRFWHHADNDPTKPLVPYRARVHIWGNCGSPTVSTISLRTTTDWADPPPTPEVTRYIRESFYVGDGCGSAPDATTAISILKGAINVLSQFGVRLCKIVSSSEEVIKAFPESEVAKDMVEVDFAEEDCLMQKSLGVAWDIKSDRLIMKVNVPDRAFTKRGILSVINSVYDPLNLAGPVILAGRLFQREILPKKGRNPEMYELGWDDPLPSCHRAAWESFKDKLPQLEKLSIPRCTTPPGFGSVVKQEIIAFSDSSQDAIGWVLYLRSTNEEGRIHCAFLSAGSKVAPGSATSIPRLELCAALNCSLAVQDVKRATRVQPDSVTCYTDSRVVLGYLENHERRFSKYVTRRVSAIKEADWRFVGTSENPADLATRPTTPRQLIRSKWLSGPDFIWTTQDEPQAIQKVSPGDLPELVTESRVMTTRAEPGPLAHIFRVLAAKAKRDSQGLFDTIFETQSSWLKAVGIAGKVMDFVKKCRSGQESSTQWPTPVEWLLREAQQSEYPDVISLLSQKQPLPEDHPLESLAPVLHRGVIRVGGRLDRAKLPYDRRHPLLVPKGHAVATMIVSHFHKRTGHQGRHLTHGAIRQGGFHVESGKGLIKKFLSECVVCRRLRAKLATQQMSDLPLDRISSATPFSNCAVDVMGPWKIARGKATRSNPGETKIWVLVVSCMSSRAVHVELLDGLDTSTMKNALFRFIAVRGTVQRIRSDQGTNFVGAQSEDKVDVDVDELQESMKNKGVEWIMNVPYASHMSGAWERKNASLRRVLEGTMALMGPRKLTRDEFHTFIVESSAIVNGTPLWDVSADPSDPMPLSPSMLLTLREVPPGPPPEDFEEEDLIAYGKKRWRRVQYLSDSFWKRWYDEYLHALTTRSKWNKIKRNLSVGDLVMLRDKAGPRNQWPIGRVTSVKMSKDNLVRSLEVAVKKQSPNGVSKTYLYQRPISEVVFLMAPGKEG